MAEEQAAIISSKGQKPVVGFIGTDSTFRKAYGHAGAIISGGKGTASDKMNALQAAGIHVVKSPAEIGETVAGLMKH
jgi:succinyl-CoA synthetase alpha subunit